MKLRLKVGISIVVFVFIIIAVAFYFLLQINPKSIVPEYIFTYADNQPEDYPTTQGAYRFAELVKEKSNGRIKILVQADGVLGDEQIVLQQVLFGGVDFVRVSLSSLTDMLPELNVLQMPYLYRNSEHMWRVLEGDIGTYFMSAFDDIDVVPLSWYDAGVRNFYSSKPIRSLEDLKGMKMRIQETELMIDMVEALGAVAVPMAYADIYSGFQKGVIEGAENNWPSYETLDHYEVAKYYTIDEHTRVPELQLCSQATWNQLSDEDKKLIGECAKESALYERELWENRETEAKNLAEKRGTVVITLELKEKIRFQEAVTRIYEEYCKDYMDIVKKINET